MSENGQGILKEAAKKRNIETSVKDEQRPQREKESGGGHVGGETRLPAGCLQARSPLHRRHAGRWILLLERPTQIMSFKSSKFFLTC